MPFLTTGSIEFRLEPRNQRVVCGRDIVARKGRWRLPAAFMGQPKQSPAVWRGFQFSVSSGSSIKNSHFASRLVSRSL